MLLRDSTDSIDDPLLPSKGVTPGEEDLSSTVT